MKKNKTAYICNDCGNEFAAWSGQCGACGAWNTIIEFKVSGKTGSQKREIKVSKIIAKRDNNFERIKTEIAEFDRVAGGGITPGSLILFGGEPGIGKSTLVLQLCAKISNTFYISAEESVEQISERARRLGIADSDIDIVSDGDLEAIKHEILINKPRLLIVDSIQTVCLSSIDSTAGSIVQVKECGLYLQRLSKEENIPIIIIGHVTKEGNLAGPRMLEHLVDVVLYFEGDRYHDLRILRGVKNRFGPTNEVGIFSMDEKGLVEVPNPSDVFLKERQNSPGSAVTVTLEGTRPLLVEVQALVAPSNFGYPRRMSSGFDLNRLNLLAAVITKTTKINLSSFDVYINVTGGMKVDEPAVDLAVVSAIVSSFKNVPLPKKIVIFGEVGLSGEVRSVKRERDRIKEAKKLGFNTIENIKNIGNLLEKI
ncbi:MAG: DNA repair protein RadA [Patescibacteria group bacterium]